MTIEEQFEIAKQKILTLEEKPGNETMLELYRFNKQAIVGDLNIDPPKMFDFVAAAKYNAWKSVTGMSREEAMSKYINLVETLTENKRKMY
ncbi:MAG: acyl-CoA-binding protein [Bacteroidetes bacterium]|nr:acyl-CoA-binding protein [Bacteroidota bacterium]